MKLKKHLLKGAITYRTNSRLEGFKKYVSEIESKFESDIKKIEERYNEKMRSSDFDEDLQHEVGEYLADEVYTIDSIFLRTFRYSSLTVIYSILETSMNSLCKHVHRLKGLSLELDDLKGGGVERAKLFLEKVALVECPRSSNAWFEIQKLNRIRNCIVHAEGEIKKTISPKKIYNIVSSTNGLDLIDRRYIGVEKEYLNSIINITENFLGELYEKAFS